MIAQAKTLKVKLELMKAQEDFVFSRDKYPAFIGGIGSGKTRGGSYKALLAILDAPNALGLIAANTYSQLRDYTVQTFRDVLKEHKITFTEMKSEKTIFVFIGGRVTAVHCRSMDNVETIRGGSYGWAWLDEARDMTANDFEVVQGRLRDRNISIRQLWITTTPFGYNWVHKKFSKEPIAGSRIFHATTADNPFLPKDYYDSLLETFDEKLAKQELGGEFLDITRGRIYHGFNRSEHVRSNLRYNPRLPLIHVWDFNVDPFSTIIIQETQRGTEVIDEIVIRDANIEEVVNELKRRYPPENHGSKAGGQWVPTHYHLYGDATGNARTVHGNFTAWDVVHECLMQGLQYEVTDHVRRSNPSRTARYNAVNARLKNAKQQKRCFIADHCHYLISDLEQMVKKVGTQEPDTSNKDLSHTSDCLGYYIEANFPVTAARSGIRYARRRG